MRVSHKINVLKTKGISLAQSWHETILRKHIEQAGGRVESGSRLVSLEQDEKGVQVSIEKTTGGEISVESAPYDYVIGADGAKGRFKLSIARPLKHKSPLQASRGSCWVSRSWERPDTQIVC